jgi:hypothetical protein
MTVRSPISTTVPPPHKLAPIDTGISSRENTSRQVGKDQSTGTLDVDFIDNGCNNIRKPDIGREKELEASHDVGEVPIPGAAGSLEEKTTTTSAEIETPEPSPNVHEFHEDEGTSPQVNDSHINGKKQADKALLDSDQNVPVTFSLLSEHAPAEKFEHSTVITGLATADSEESKVIVSDAGQNITTGYEHNDSKLTQFLPTEDSVREGSSPQSEGTVQDGSETSSINEVKDGHDSSYRSSEDRCAVSPTAFTFPLL